MESFEGDRAKEMKNKFRKIRYVFYACILLPVFLFIFLAVIAPQFGFHYWKVEFTELNGVDAQKRLDDWPSKIDGKNVQKVWYKNDFIRDANSYWYRIELDEETASIWCEIVHKEFEDYARKTIKTHFWNAEGVHRQISGPPDLHRHTGTIPDWWNPPSIDFRATEVMGWYENYRSGVGKLIYSAFDDETNTLWIYNNSCQHDILWEHGNIPDGEVLLKIEEALKD